MQFRKSLATLLRAFENLFSKHSLSQPAPTPALAFEPLEQRALYSAAPTLESPIPYVVYGPPRVDITPYSSQAIRGDTIQVRYFVSMRIIDGEYTLPPDSPSVEPGLITPSTDLSISFFLDTDKDGKITDADTSLASNLPIAVNGSFSIDTSGLELGQQTILARISEPFPALYATPVIPYGETMNVVTGLSTSFMLYRAVSSAPAPGNKSAITYTDTNGNSVKASINNAATLKAYFLTEENQNGDISILQILSPNASTLTITVVGADPSDKNAATHIDTITTSGPSNGILVVAPPSRPNDYVRAINAPQVDLTGSLYLSGPIQSIVLHDVVQANIMLLDAHPQGVSIKLHDLIDSTVTVNGFISSFNINSWFNTYPESSGLSAFWINSLTCESFFHASLSTGAGLQNRPSLVNAAIKGVVSGKWDAYGPVGSISMESAQNWSATFERVNSITLGKNPSSSVDIHAAFINSLVINSDITDLTLDFNAWSSTPTRLNRLLVRGDVDHFTLQTNAENARIGSLAFQGRLYDAHISVTGRIDSITAKSITDTSISVNSLGLLRTSGNVQNLNLTDARPQAPDPSSPPQRGPFGIGSISIGGTLTDSFIQTYANLASISAQTFKDVDIEVDGRLGLLFTPPPASYFSAEWGWSGFGPINANIIAGSIGSIRSASSIESQITSRSSIDAIFAKDDISHSTIRAEASIFAINTGSLLHSKIYSGSPENNPNALIGTVVVRNTSLEAPSFRDSIISGQRIGSVALRYMAFSNDYRPTGIYAARMIGRVTSSEPLVNLINLGPSSAPFTNGNFIITAIENPFVVELPNFYPIPQVEGIFFSDGTMRPN